MSELRIPAVIPARGGSTRVPRKNVRDMLGKPAIGWVIEALQASDVFSHVIVSTDDDEIAEVAESCGASAPQRRTASVDDFATLQDAMVETLSWFGHDQPEWFACVLPTAVLPPASAYREAWRQLQVSGAASLQTVVQCPTPPEIAFTINSDGTRGEVFSDRPRLARTQDYAAHYWDAGQFYFLQSAGLEERGHLLDAHPYCFELSALEAQDIDSPADWELASLKLQRKLDLDLR